MAKIDIFSGFLGAGKTTLIKKLIREAYQGEKLVLIENEFGDIGIDGGFLQEAGIQITEMNSGCICCSLVGDFSTALQKVEGEFHPDRILIEPSGVGKLSDVIKAVKDARLDGGELNVFCTVVDAPKSKMYMKNFGEFFLDQTKHASCIVLSHTNGMTEEKLAETVARLKEVNPTATFVTEDWDLLDGKTILRAMEQKDSLQVELARLHEEMHHHHHHHHDEDCCCGHEHHHHDEDCCCGHEHHHHDEDCCCGHEHHHHDEDCCCGHEHHHHDEDCCCGHEHHHHHHHADEVFTSWGVETTKMFRKEELENILVQLSTEETFGTILRAKGIVKGENGWLHFDYVPGEPDLRVGGASTIGRLCVIGCNLKEEALKKVFGV